MKSWTVTSSISHNNHAKSTSHVCIVLVQLANPMGHEKVCRYLLYSLARSATLCSSWTSSSISGHHTWLQQKPSDNYQEHNTNLAVIISFAGKKKGRTQNFEGGGGEGGAYKNVLIAWNVIASEVSKNFYYVTKASYWTWTIPSNRFQFNATKLNLNNTL